MSSLIAFVATTRIQGHIADHEVFWMSALGVLNVSLVVGAAATAIGDAARTRPAQRPLAVTVGCVCMFLVAAISGVREMRNVLERSSQSADDRAVDALVVAVHQSLSDTGARRPLFAIEPSAWYTAAGALLQIDKAGIPFAVDDRWTTMFGESFAPTGREDARWTIAGSNREPVLVSRLNATGAPR